MFFFPWFIFDAKPFTKSSRISRPSALPRSVPATCLSWLIYSRSPGAVSKIALRLALDLDDLDDLGDLDDLDDLDEMT